MLFGSVKVPITLSDGPTLYSNVGCIVLGDLYSVYLGEIIQRNVWRVPLKDHSVVIVRFFFAFEFEYKEASGIT